MVDPWRLRPKERLADTRAFCDESQGVTINLTFRAVNAVESAAMMDRVESLVKTHITDDVPFPPVGGEVVTVSRALFENVSLLEAMQPPDAGERYSAEEFVALAYGLSSETWLGIQRFAQDVNERASKNGSGPVGNTLSAPASAITSGTPS